MPRSSGPSAGRTLVLAIADCAKGVAPGGVQLVEYLLRLLNDTSGLVRGIRRVGRFISDHDTKITMRATRRLPGGVLKR